VIDFEAIGVRTKVSAEILADIDHYCATTYDDGPRKHLGASLIGHACSRHLWFGFRWAKHTKHSGRQQRLFNRGHREEARFNEWLRGIGFTVFDVNPETKEQWRFSACEGHFGGSCDGKAMMPAKYEYNKPILLEFKTNGTGAAFNNLLKDGCASAKPQHFDQQSVYGYLDGIPYSLYMNICKNDDNIHSEIVRLDLKRGENLVKKAEIIILSQVPPPKLSLSKTSFECKYCDHMSICHEGAPLDINCRSCKAAQPIANKQWYCNKHNGAIPEEFIAKGCGDWMSVRD
jgi:hypothetical protein